MKARVLAMLLFGIAILLLLQKSLIAKEGVSSGIWQTAQVNILALKALLLSKVAMPLHTFILVYVTAND